MRDSEESPAIRVQRIRDAEKLAEQLLVEAERDRAKELADLFDKEGGEHPPSYLLAVATLAAHAMARSSDPKLLRMALLMMIDRQFADAEFIRQSEEAGADMVAMLANKEPAGRA